MEKQLTSDSWIKPNSNEEMISKIDNSFTIVRTSIKLPNLLLFPSKLVGWLLVQKTYWSHKLSIKDEFVINVSIVDIILDTAPKVAIKLTYASPPKITNVYKVKFLYTGSQSMLNRIITAFLECKDRRTLESLIFKFKIQYLYNSQVECYVLFTDSSRKDKPKKTEVRIFQLFETN